MRGPDGFQRQQRYRFPHSKEFKTPAQSAKIHCLNGENACLPGKTARLEGKLAQCGQKNTGFSLQSTVNT